MRVIQYKDSHFNANVALVVKLDKFSRPQVLTPSGLQSAHTNQWNTYWSAVQANTFTTLVAENFADYSLFTIDLYHFSRLYIKYNDTVYNVFDGFYEIIQRLTSFDMSNTMNFSDDTIKVSVLAGSEVSLLQPTLSAKQNFRTYCTGAGAVSSRLVNIAVPVADASQLQFFAKISSNTTGELLTTDDGKLQVLNAVKYAAATYDTSDYSFVQQPIGQRFDIRKSAKLQLSVIVEAFGSSMNLATNCGINVLSTLAEVLTVTEDDLWYHVTFIYNSNRTYTIAANVPVTAHASIPTNSISISTDDMLKHAYAAGVTVEDKYIVSPTKQYTYTIPTIYETVRGRLLNIYEWVDDNMKYVSYYPGMIEQPIIARQLFADKNNGCLVGIKYKHQNVQSCSSNITYNLLMHSLLADIYGNAETAFICIDHTANNPANYVIPDAYKVQYDMSDVQDDLNAESQVNANFVDKDLPYVNGDTACFNNLRLLFRSHTYDNKQVAIVVVVTDNASKDNDYEVVESSMFVVIKLWRFVDSQVVRTLPAYWYTAQTANMPPNVLVPVGVCPVQFLNDNYDLDLPVKQISTSTDTSI